MGLFCSLSANEIGQSHAIDTDYTTRLEANRVHDIWMRISGNLADRISGPMQLRVVLRPVMASIFVVLSGLKGAKAKKPPYFWRILTHPDQRGDMLKNGGKSIGKVFILALILDIAYQIIELHYIYTDEALIVGLALAVGPSLILCGAVNRLASRR